MMMITRFFSSLFLICYGFSVFSLRTTSNNQRLVTNKYAKTEKHQLHALNDVHRNSHEFSEKNWRSLISSTLVLSVSIFGAQIMPAHAASMSASEIFAKAETAIENTDKNYKTALSEWNKSKKVLDESMKKLGKTDELVASVSKDVGTIDEKMTKIMNEVEAIKQTIANDVDAQTTITSSKYAIAEESSTSGKNPAVIAKNFKEAENEADILNQQKKLLEEFSEAAKGSKEALIKAQEAVASSNVVLDKTDKISASQKEGISILNEGIDTSIKLCRDSLIDCSSKQQDGVSRFKYGTSVLRKASEKFDKVVTDVDNDQKKVQKFTAEVELLSSRMESVLTSIEDWQKENHLTVKTSLQPAKAIIKELNDVDKSAVAVLKRFVSTRATFTSGDNKKEEAIIENALQKVLGELAAAEEQGKKAEALLTAAKSIGDRESASYLKKSPTTSKLPSSMIQKIK